MKAGILSFLVLLGSINEVCEGADTPVERCGDSMVCLAPLSCKDKGIDNKLMELAKTDSIFDKCAIIIKFRKYSKSKFRIVLESRDPKVEKISVKKQSGALFSCEKGKDPKFKNGAPKSVFATSNDHVMCEFEVEETGGAAMFGTGSTKVKATAEDGAQTKLLISETPEISVAGNLAVDFCDPAKAQYEADSTPGIASTTFDVGLTDITCAAPYYLWTKTSTEPDFVKSGSVECKNDGGTYKFTISRDAPETPQTVEPSKRFKARCASPVCALCDETTAELSGDSNAVPKIKNVDNCKELTCETRRMKVGDEVSVGTAKCESENDQPVWMLDGKPVKATVTCVDPVRCPKPEGLCPAGTCVVGSDLLPTCGPQSILMYNKKPINLTCNDFKGKYEYPGPNGPRTLPDGATLTCGKQDTEPKAQPVTASLWSKISIPVIIVGILILIGLGIGVYFRVRYLNKKRLQSVKSSAKGTVKSKESLSASALPSSAKLAPAAATPTATPSATPTARPATPPAPESPAPAAANNVYDRLGLGPALRPLPPELMHPEESERMKKILKLAAAAEQAKKNKHNEDNQEEKDLEKKEKKEPKEKKEKKGKNMTKDEIKERIAECEKKMNEFDGKAKDAKAVTDFLDDCSGKGLATAGGKTEAPGPDPFGSDKKKKKQKEEEKKPNVKAIPSDVESDSQTGPGPKKKN